MAEPCAYCGDNTAQGSALHLDRRSLDDGRFACAECYNRFARARQGSDDARRRQGVQGIPPQFRSLGLGDPVVVLRPLTNWKWINFITGAILALVAGFVGAWPGMFAAAAVASVLAPGLRGREGDVVLVAGAAIGAITAVALLLLFLRRSYRGHARAIGLFSRGLAVERRSGSFGLPWSEIAGTRQRHVRATGAIGPVPVQGRTVSTYSILPKSGDPLVFDSNFEDADWLFARIEGVVQPQVLMDAARALDAGGNVSFGPISVSNTGVVVSNSPFSDKDFPWAELKEVAVHEGKVRFIANRGVGAIVDIDKIDNVNALLSLVQARRRSYPMPKSASPSQDPAAR